MANLVQAGHLAGQYVTAPAMVPAFFDVEDFFGGILNYFSDLLKKSASEEFAGMAKSIQSVAWPSFDEGLGAWLAGNAWGLALTLALPLITYMGIKAMITRNLTPVMGVAKSLLVMMVFGAVVSLFMSFGVMISDSLSGIGVMLSEKAGGPNWINQFSLPGITDVIDAGLIFILVKIFGFMMKMMVLMVTYSLFIFVPALIVAYVFRNSGKAGDRIWRLTVSAAIAALAIKPIVTLLMGLGTVGLVVIPNPPGGNVPKVVAVMLMIYVLSPLCYFLIMWATNHQYVKQFGDHETKSQVEGKVDVNKIPDREQVTSQVINSRTSTLAHQFDTTAIHHRLTQQPSHPQSNITVGQVVKEGAKDTASRATDTAIASGVTAVTGSPAAGTAAVAAKRTLLSKARSKKG